MTWTRPRAAMALTGLLSVPVLVVAGPWASEDRPAAPGSTVFAGYGSSSGNSGAGRGNGGGDGTSPKSFTISGAVTELAPGVVRPLFLTVANPNKQALSVTGLVVTALSATRGGEPAPACEPGPDTVQIGSWPVGPFTVPAESARTSPTPISVTMPNTAPDACQGVTFSLSYSGTAVRA